MKHILLFILSILSLPAMAQWDNFWGGNWDWNNWGNFGGGGINFGGDGNGSGDLSQYRSQKDINYAGDGQTSHSMDIYWPEDDGNVLHPVVIHIYGSAWTSNNSKGTADLGTVGAGVLGAGYIFVTPNHRNSSEAQWPAQLNDIKAVVRYLRANAEDLKIDTSFIAVSGFSSGGHIATMMGATRNVEGTATHGGETMDMEGTVGPYTQYSSSVDAVCDWSGPVILDQMDCGSAMDLSSYEGTLLGGSASQQPDRYALATAVTFLDPTDPPYMLVHGSADNIVAQCQSEMLYDELQRAGVVAEYHPTDGGHGVYEGKVPAMIEFLAKARQQKAERQKAGLPGVQATAVEAFFCHGTLFITRRGTAAGRFTLCTAAGTTVASGVLTGGTATVGGLQHGVYILRTEDNKPIKLLK